MMSLQQPSYTTKQRDGFSVLRKERTESNDSQIQERMDKLNMITKNFFNYASAWKRSLSAKQKVMHKAGKSMTLLRNTQWSREDEETLKQHQAGLRKRALNVI